LAWAFFYALKEKINLPTDSAADQVGIAGYIEGLRWVLSGMLYQAELVKQMRIQEEQERRREEREAVERQQAAAAYCGNSSNDTKTCAFNPAMVVGWPKYTRAV